MNRRLFLTSLATAPLPAFQYVPKQSDRPEPSTGDEPGFKPIFDGKTLEGWEGDPKYWRVEDGCLVGEITPETLIKVNTFIIWRGGAPKDFELKADYRITARGNSGINYRSVVVPETNFAMRGYQADIDGPNNYTGQNYEERGRLFLALRGQMTRVVEGRKPIVLSTFADPKEFITADWNSYHLIIRGNVLTHILNGHLMCVVIDDDPVGRKMEGLIGVQVHVGPPMKVEYRNFRLRELNAPPPLRYRADAGDPDAQFTLAKNYEAGRSGLKQDYAEAARWYRKSADQGNVYAQASLGILYHSGKGLPHDDVQAEAWFIISADHAPPNDRDTIVEMRDSVAAHLTPQQLAEAQRLAREWKPKH